ncbi:membrane protease subunit HflC [Natronospira proteinivora]|uniref:Protein HflC n=1 Tax=Natronospira proteinivora TaxID=1807133 RepID=A0ABT1G4K0_9GAMM|nr:protease modulator HflC [Natronospira proteinivora]MCP1726214.1 membrane protease subunit HflC [Natronospira proteinivora]
MNRWLVPILIVLGLLAILAYNSIFIVDEREAVVKLRFGEMVQENYEPGLHFKLPFADRVLKFERRIITLDHRPERFLTQERKNVLVDFFVKWRIEDAGDFYRATRGDMAQARERMLEISRAGIRNEFARRQVEDVIAAERMEMMRLMVDRGRDAASELGVSIVDFRIKQIELPDDVTQSVFDRMVNERRRDATLLRAQGEEGAERIRADADRQREEILADAYRRAEEIRGDGDARATEIYATAYEVDREFFSFYRSLTAYQRALGQEGKDIMVLEPEGEFFRYFKEMIPETQ